MHRVSGEGDPLDVRPSFGPVFRRLIGAMAPVVRTLVKGGNPVIFDHVLHDQAMMESCTAAFAGLRVFSVGITCDLAILEAREEGSRRPCPWPGPRTGGCRASFMHLRPDPGFRSARARGLRGPCGLRLFVDAEHHRLIGRVQVETDDVADFLDKEGIRGELVAVRLPRSGDASAGAAAPRRSAASGAPWSWRSQWQRRVSERSSGCCHQAAWSAAPG